MTYDIISQNFIFVNNEKKYKIKLNPDVFFYERRPIDFWDTW